MAHVENALGFLKSTKMRIYCSMFVHISHSYLVDINNRLHNIFVCIFLLNEVGWLGLLVTEEFWGTTPWKISLSQSNIPKKDREQKICHDHVGDTSFKKP